MLRIWEGNELTIDENFPPPVKLSGQEQLKDAIPSIHSPPFIQGSDRHSSQLISQE